MASMAEARLAAAAAASALRDRAASVHPDEELQASIAANAVAADSFAIAYAALRERGLTDKALDRFGVENATPAEMREAADLIEQLAQMEEVPRKRRHYQRMSKSRLREYRFAGILFFLIASLVLVMFGAVFARNALGEYRKWRFAREYAAPAPVAAGRVPEPVPAAAPPLAPVSHGFEKTAANRTVPSKPRDFVTDRARILEGETARLLNGRLLQFERETSNQLLVFIDQRLPPDTSIEEMGVASLEHWGVGQKEKDNGVIFFVFVADRRMRIEVGYGLEGVLTDARAKRILSQIVQPLFREGRYAEGIDAGTRAIMEVIREGDVAINRVAVSSGAVRASTPLLIFYAVATAVFLTLMALLLRSFILFMQGYQNGIFRMRRGSGGGSGGGGSSGSDSGSDSGGSSGSYSGGGGSGGGGGASDSW